MNIEPTGDEYTEAPGDHPPDRRNRPHKPPPIPEGQQHSAKAQLRKLHVLLMLINNTPNQSN